MRIQTELGECHEMPVEHQRIVSDIEKINSFNATPGDGITRITFSDEYQAARAWLIEEMQSLGMAVRTDRFGNLLGRLEGKQPSLPTIMAGSHLDTVANGGRFDDVVGVVAALETARRIVAEGPPLLCPYTVVVFAAASAARRHVLVVDVESCQNTVSPGNPAGSTARPRCRSNRRPYGT